MAAVLFLAAVQGNGKPIRFPKSGMQPKGQRHGVFTGVFDGVCGKKTSLTYLICNTDTKGKRENITGIFIAQRELIFLPLCHPKGLMIQISVEIGTPEAVVHRQGIFLPTKDKFATGSAVCRQQQRRAAQEGVTDIL